MISAQNLSGYCVNHILKNRNMGVGNIFIQVH